ncbi:MAG: dTDP-4-dehydrorhamnose reductase [Barnesiella sp.]|nr:dTDP-4-dehydrorhamnose reductase [Barnesiella sp.]MBD5253106.1 dTDP-4-dehydrorhamnose reductase [Barnesiella sp.]
MNILITGANGQLGRCLRDRVEAGAVDNYIFTDRVELDITSPAEIVRVVTDHNVDMIINCAAYTDVERAEDDESTARLINSDAPGYLAEAMKARGGWLIHISTDYVFGGNTGNTPRGEDEPENPTGVYGVTKLDGEKAIERSGVDALILRTAWLYSEYGKNFVKTMMRLTADRPHLNVVFDQTGTPTYARDLADAIISIVDRRLFIDHAGVYHYTDEGVTSWYDFACCIAALAGNDRCDIQPCHSYEFPSKVIRPSYSVLDKTKIKTTFGIKIPHWATSLADCVDKLKNE